MIREEMFCFSVDSTIWPRFLTAPSGPIVDGLCLKVLSEQTAAKKELKMSDVANKPGCWNCRNSKLFFDCFLGLISLLFNKLKGHMQITVDMQA